MKKIISLSAVAVLSTSLFANTDMQTQIDQLTQKLDKLEKKQKKQSKKLSAVNKLAAKDNIKFSLNFRNAIDILSYKDNDTGLTAHNPSLLTSQLHLNMAASPMNGLIFKGQLAVYSTWGTHLYVDDAPLKDWAGSSKPTDSVMRIREAYFVYSNSLGEQPVSMSIGRRPATNGSLAHYRENEETSGSPLAHVTNMEVNAAMVKLSWDRFLEGAYSKVIYGRAHNGEMNNVYGTDSTTPWSPYATTGTVEDDNVDFIALLGDIYNDGQYQVMYQETHIINTKGKRLSDGVTKAASGTAELASIALKVDGIGDEINDFLDDTTIFVSLATTYYNAKDGYSLIGSTDGGDRQGYSYWLGAIIPDGFTENGKFGLEYNHGSKYWTPMTWAEDTATGSKIAVRGSAYEAYWNFNLFGVKYLPSQLRYTYTQHDYTPNISCSGWVTPVDADITSQDIRFSIAYRY
jgi:X-X-X-Leu-X-X-Gly heptad repeat protein